MPSEFETVITDQTEYGTIITTQGAAIIADCILNGKKLPIVEAAAGDGGGEATIPTPGQTALVNERWRGEIAGKSLSPTTPNMIDVKVVIEDSVGGFTIREMGLYSDTGVLIAVCNTPATEKVSISGGVSGKLTMLMHIVVADASVLDFIINPSLDTVNRQELEAALEAHNTDPEAHPDIREDILAALESTVAEKVRYDNEKSGLEAVNVQDAIDRLAQGNTGYRVLAVYGKGDGGPEGPVDPGEPEEPGDTGELEGPGGTENPDGGGEPEEPGGPVDPENPEGPESPDDSGAEGGEG